MSSSERIILRPVRASDFQGEMDGLVQALGESLPEFRVEVWNPLKSLPGSLPAISEVLTVILPFAGGYAFNKAADAVVGSLRSAHKQEDDHRPARVVEFYGRSGEVLKRIQITDDFEDLGPGE